MPADTPPRSAEICQRLLRGYQFSPSDHASDDLGPLYGWSVDVDPVHVL